jgi:hypothetical protein
MPQMTMALGAIVPHGDFLRRVKDFDVLGDINIQPLPLRINQPLLISCVFARLAPVWLPQ